jgi:hypothetical protein
MFVIRLLSGTRGYLPAVPDNFSRCTWARVVGTFAPLNGWRCWSRRGVPSIDRHMAMFAPFPQSRRYVSSRTDPRRGGRPLDTDIESP